MSNNNDICDYHLQQKAGMAFFDMIHTTSQTLNSGLYTFGHLSYKPISSFNINASIVGDVGNCNGYVDTEGGVHIQFYRTLQSGTKIRSQFSYLIK